MAKKAKASKGATDGEAPVLELAEEPGNWPCNIFSEAQKSEEDGVLFNQGITDYSWCPVCSVMICGGDNTEWEGAVASHQQQFHPACIV